MRFALISGKDISAPSWETPDYVRTEYHAIILLPFGTEGMKISQEMMKYKMNSNNIAWILKPELPLEFHIFELNKFNFSLSQF